MVRRGSGHSVNKRFTATGSYLALAGDWKIQVILRRSGFDDVSQAFDDVKLNPAYSTLQVFDTNGLRIDQGDGGVDPSDPTVQMMRVSLPAVLPPGYYLARWRAVTDEGVHTGHVTEGQFRRTPDCCYVI